VVAVLMLAVGCLLVLLFVKTLRKIMLKGRVDETPVLCPRSNVGLSRSASVKDARKKPEAYCRRSRISDAADFMLPQERIRQNNWDTVLVSFTTSLG
jgi:hypothetical protein